MPVARFVGLSAGIASSPAAYRLEEALEIPAGAAAGYLSLFLLQAVQHSPTMALASLPDGVLEGDDLYPRLLALPEVRQWFTPFPLTT